MQAPQSSPGPSAHESKGGAFPPPGREPAFALSVDVEDYYQVEAFAARVARDCWTRYPGRVEHNTRRLLDLFDRTGARATFFTLGWVARRYPGLVREIHARGHEVASHGMDHRMLTELTPDQFREDARVSRSLLESVIGAPVRGYRAPSYSIGPSTLWALEVLGETGYEYDSSIFPVRGLRYGYPSGPTTPVRIPTRLGSIAEFPLPTISLGPWRLPVLAGAYLRILPAWLSLAVAASHRGSGRPLVVNVHPWEIDPDQPTVGPSRIATWTHYFRLGRTESTLRRLLESHRFAGVASRLEALGLIDARAAAGSAGP